ncbi:MAG: endo-1,4-beta-xylanase [Lachnospiraceae bacterium]|nr:endo-1,4-beta-xylanase [Lachnospiraceae bacterium]
MKRACVVLTASLLLMIVAVSCGKQKKEAEPTPSVTEQVTPEVTPTPTPVPDPWADQHLKDRYDGVFMIGVALSNSVMRNPDHMAVVKQEFNSFTFGNEMKPDALLDKDATQQGYPDTNTEPVLTFRSVESGMRFAQENGFVLRGHTLCWYSQTPSWFFTEDYKTGSPLCSREVMIARLDSYIKQVMEYFQTNYPGMIYAWDVVNEAVDKGNGDENAIRKTKNLWYETIGPDFIQYAFRFARKYSDGTAKLYYNDYNCYEKTDEILKALAPIKEEGNIDGIGMQCHLGSGENIQNHVYKVAKKFSDAGYKVQITELDIEQSKTGYAETMQGIKYKLVFQYMEEAKKNGDVDIDSITIWGLSDADSWKSSDKPVLFKLAVGGLDRKPAWYGAMQDPSIEAFEW